MTESVSLQNLRKIEIFPVFLEKVQKGLKSTNVEKYRLHNYFAYLCHIFIFQKSIRIKINRVKKYIKGPDQGMLPKHDLPSVTP